MVNRGEGARLFEAIKLSRGLKIFSVQFLEETVVFDPCYNAKRIRKHLCVI
jgi:hypothetical protein